MSKTFPEQLTSDSPFFIFAIADVSYIDDLPPSTVFIGLDSVISFCLAHKNRATIGLQDMLPEDRFEQVITETFQELNRKLANSQEFNLRQYELVQASLYDLVLEIQTLLLLKHQLLQVVPGLKPEKAYLFTPRSLKEHVLLEVLQGYGCQIEIVERKKSFIKHLLGRIRSKLPFLGWERKYYVFFTTLLRPGSILRKWKITPAHKLKNKSAEVLVGPIAYREDLIEVIDILANKNRTQNHQTPVVVAQPALYELDLVPLKQCGIPYFYMDLVSTNKVTAGADLFRQEIDDNRRIMLLILNQFFGENLSATVVERMGSDRHFSWLILLRNELRIVISKLNPQVAYLTSFFSSASRMACFEYRRTGVKTLALMTSLDQFIFGVRQNSIDARTSSIDNYLPCSLIVGHESLGAGLQLMFPIENQLRIQVENMQKFESPLRSMKKLENLEEIRVRVHAELGLDPHLRLIVFTTQQHDYSFEYVRMVVQAFHETLAENPSQLEAKDVNWRLIIKVHPKEFKWIYSSLLSMVPKQQAKYVVVVQTIDVHDLIASSEVLVTYFSFTAMEALALGTPVVRMNMAGSVRFPEFDSSIELTSARTFEQLKGQLYRVMYGNERTASERHHRGQCFAHMYFQTSCDGAP